MTTVQSMRCGAAVLCALACAGLGGACSNSGPDEANSEPGGGGDPIRLEVLGGQSGVEGGCPDSAVDELPFDADAAAELVLGEHAIELVYTYGFMHDGGDRERVPLTVEIAARGEPRVELDCGGFVELDVRVILRREDPDVSVVFDATALVESDREARLWVRFEPALSEHLALARPAGFGTDQTEVLQLWFAPAAVSGSLGIEREGGPLCDFAVVAGGAGCGSDGRSRPVDIDDAAFEPALQRLGKLDARALRWQDGSTATLSVSVQGAAAEVCGSPYAPSSPTDVQDGTVLDRVVTLALATSDGRVDVALPVHVNALYSQSQGLTGSNTLLRAEAMVPAAALADGEPEAPLSIPSGSLIAISLGGTVGESVVRVMLEVTSFGEGGAAPDAPVDLAGPGGPDLECFTSQRVAVATLE